MNVPDLDDREFAEVFEEAKRQIPVHTDEWTDHNRHDTGIAILEVLTWISETYTYQIDQISTEDRRKYLQLLGLTRRPPQPATAALSASPPPAADGVVVPAGQQLSVDDRSGTTKTFETTRETTLLTAALTRVLTHSGGDTVNNTTESETENTHFYAFGDDPDEGDALYLGFDGDPFTNTEEFELTVEYNDDDLPEPATHGDAEPQFEPSVAVEWEYCTHYPAWDDEDAWAPLPVVADETNALYGGGRITFAEPPGWLEGETAVATTRVHDQPSGLVWIRCRIDTPGYEIPPQLDGVRLNVLDISHRRTIENELLRRDDETLETTIQSNQEFFFDNAPVLEATITIDGETWTEVPDFDTSAPGDRHYVIDNQRGAVTFGNGIDGAKPPVGEHVVAERYVYGGGADGNVAETDQWRFRDPDKELTDGLTYEDLPVRPLGPATGGEAMETPDDAMDRFKRDFKEPSRAATVDDYSYVATHTPGLRFGRAHATSRTKRTPDGEGIREIEVVVVPYSTRSKPAPSEGFREAVERHLYENRLVTDPVRVREPEYVDIGVTVTVSELPGYSEAAVTSAVTEALIEYVHPIDGFDGDGWPFGQPLYIAEVEAEIEALPSVRAVEGVSLSARGEEKIDEYGNVYIDDTALVSLSSEEVRVSFTSGHDEGGAY
jgi:hypothetical protein